MTYELSANTREQTGKGAARQLRRDGLIPGICYGTAVVPFGVSVDPVQLDRLLRASPQGRNTVIDLSAGDSGDHHVMVQEIQRDPVRRQAVHVDFRVVRDEDQILVSVPIIRIGRSPAEEMGGRVELVRRRVDLHCKVKDIPDSISHDVSELDMGDRVRASELAIPEGSKLLYTSDFVVLNVVAPRDEEEEEAEVDLEGEEELEEQPTEES